jgi:tetratricopeptide (TPR) repeat protein
MDVPQCVARRRGKARFLPSRIIAAFLVPVAAVLLHHGSLSAQAPPLAQASAAAGSQMPAETQAQLDKLQAALKAAQAAGDAGTAAKTFNEIAALYFRISEFQKALEYSNQALPIYRQVGDRSGEASTLLSIGIVYSTLGEKQKALEYYNQALPILRALADRVGEAATLTGIATVYSSLGQPQKTLEYYNQALPLLRALGDRAGEATSLTGIGIAYSSLGEQQKALENYNQALPIRRLLGDRRGEATTLLSIGLVYSHLGEKQKALEYYGQALPILRALADRAGEATTLTGIATAHSSLGQQQKALEYYSQALPVYRLVGDRRGEATTLDNIGLVYSGLGEPQKALEYLNQELPIRRLAGDRGGEASTLNNMGAVYSGLGEQQKALEYYSQALPIYHRVGDRDGEATTLNNIGLVYSDLGQPQKALEYYNQALPVHRLAGDRDGEASTLNNIGALYSGLGEQQKALEYYNQTLRICRLVGNQGGEATTLVNIGKAYSDLGEKQKALESYNQALPAFRLIGDRSDEATTLNNIGGIYSDLGQKPNALEYYNQALPILHQVGNRGGEATTLNNIGFVYSDLGQQQKALEYYNQALPIMRQVGNRGGEAATLNNIGYVYSDLGQKQKALEYCNQTLQLYRLVGDRAGEATALNDIGALYSDLGEEQEALENFNQALLIATTVHNPLVEALIFHNLMRKQQATQPSLSIFYGKQAVDLLQQVRSNIQGLDQELQKSFLTSKEGAYRDLANLLIDQGRLPEAQEIINLLKEQQFRDFTRAGTKSGTRPVSLSAVEQKMDDAYQQETRNLLATYEEWSALNKKAGRTPEEEKRLADLTSQVQQGSRQYEALLNKLGTILHGAEQEKLERARQDVPGLANLVSNLEPGTVALYTLVVGDRYRVIVIRANHALVERSTAIKAVELRRRAEQFVTLLSQKGSDPQELLNASQGLYTILIGPIADDLKQAQAHTLVWELDDVLHYIPMSALYDAQSRQFLVEKYASVIITPASVSGSVLRETPELNDAKLLALGLSRKYEDDFPALENVPLELGSIVKDPRHADTHGLFAGTEWLDDDFTEKNLQTQLSGRDYKVVHIASHFNADPGGDDMRSFLLLAGKDLGGSGFHLTLDEFKTNPNLETMQGVELLTLSACKTAVASQASDGHEIDGLGGVGQKLGAHAVMASLWEVNDESTGDLMADFYQHWVNGAGKVTKVEALRQAQQDLLKGRITPKPQPDPNAPISFAHPYYWAPFILMGNWR